MKKLLTFILTLVLLITGTVFAFGCKPKNDETVLNIVCYNRGFGRVWIDALVEKFEQDHPGYKVNLEATASAKTLIQSHLYGSNNIDDLYISVGADWMTYAAQGKFASLDDIMDDEIDGVTLRDKVAVEYQNSINYPDREGNLHTYRLPWISATGGIFYNAKMFEKYGWEIPETYEELVALCQKITSDKVLVDDSTTGDLVYVKPFVYTSQNPDYFDYTVYTWWAQLAGIEAINQFKLYESAENFSTQSNPTYQKLQTATELWYNLFDKSKGYALERSSNNDAQLALCNGEAAMMFNGDWMYNEILNYQLNDEDFRLSIMKTPTAPDAVDPDILYTVGEDQYIAIPATSIKQDLAKEFIKLMVSDYGCNVFLEKANGMLGYNFTADTENANDYIKDLMQVRSEYTTRFTSYPSMEGQVINTTKMLYLTSQIEVWGSGALRPYDNLINTKDYTIEKAFSTIYAQMSSSWSRLLSQAGIK